MAQCYLVLLRGGTWTDSGTASSQMTRNFVPGLLSSSESLVNIAGSLGAGRSSLRALPTVWISRSGDATRVAIGGIICRSSDEKKLQLPGLSHSCPAGLWKTRSGASGSQRYRSKNICKSDFRGLGDAGEGRDPDPLGAACGPGGRRHPCQAALLCPAWLPFQVPLPAPGC
jgi:hypothetical protein